MRRALGAADRLWRSTLAGAPAAAALGSYSAARAAAAPPQPHRAQRQMHGGARGAPPPRGAGAAAAAPSSAASPAEAAGAAVSEEEATAAIRARFQRRTCLVQGASRGLGLEFVRQLLAVPDTTVVAACRDPAGAAALQRLLLAEAPHTAGGGGPSYDAVRQRLHIVQLDVCDEDSIQRAAEEVSGLVDGLDLLLNCSGVLHSGPAGMAPGGWMEAEEVARVVEGRG
ncbi:hypothetical protein TSOC_010669 [Tetrabaena socialis]|uniref:Uncharacterized protein n=1 Tax=Tetrabaena socialis TaxID=47790 RepID=A0A2J7ZSR2_9CHLO|nr:hypothetical protein TSOC_010669 [Tetrabaena socialis]|eukprot:PNH03280.1 hypothetical protein TSOC_010669 [Tetrabaena socialis]